MTDSLLVVLDDVIAGTLERLPSGRLRFDYTEEYRGRPGATPISLSMPPQVRSHPDRTITPWLWGLLPDNDPVLARWARQFHVSSSSPFSLLSTQIGQDCAGAVRFAPPEESDRLLARPGGITWLTEDEMGQRLRDLREDSTSWLAPLYDMASALPYDMHERKLRFAMKIGGDYRVFPYRNTWPEMARELALDADALVGRARVLAALAPDVFADAAKAPDVEALGRPSPMRLVDLVADRSEGCSQLIEGAAPAT